MKRKHRSDDLSCAYQATHPLTGNRWSGDFNDPKEINLKNTLTPNQQAALRANGLLAEPEHLWASLCGGFVLEPRNPDEKRRNRVRLGTIQ